MIYLELLLSYLKIGFFGFGGGYAMLSLISDEIVLKHGWLTAAQFTDVIAVSQMTPGPIAINCATYVGYLVTGSVWGSVLTTFAVSLPPITIMLFVSMFYLRVRDNAYVKEALTLIKPITIGMIGAAALMLCNRQTFSSGWLSYALFSAAFIASWLKIHPIAIILVAAVAGMLDELMKMF
ncbi:MAG: chromate transporter [Alistipes sp.]|nr:chromate transporter [Candidatus Minthomonas equi]